MILGRLSIAGLAALVVMLTASACAGADDDTAESTAPSAQSATHSSVVPGVTRSSSATTAPPPQATSVALEEAFPGLPALERPIEMLQLPGESTFLVALQQGIVHAFEPADPASLGLVLDQTARTSRDNNEEGLLGMALSPNFEDDGYIYLYYSAAGGPRRTVISRFETSGSGTGLAINSASELQILEVEQPFGNHKGGKLTFGPDGMLYLGLGDGGSGGDPRGNGQDIARNLLGSIIRIDVSESSAEAPYAIPSDNPFASDANARPETYAYGLRNPWRFSFDRETGNLWAGDVGQNAFEEIDIIVPGGNYGWNIMEGRACYLAASCNQVGLVLPVVDYSHDDGGCSITGGFVYRGDDIPGLAGTYLYTDFCNGDIWGLDAAAAVSGTAVEPVALLDTDLPITSFAEDTAGELYALSFDSKIYRVVAD